MLFPWTHSIYYIDSTLLFLVSASSFNPPALPASRALPSHLVLLSFLASAPLTPALAGRWLICAPGNLCPPAFFTCKASKTPENLSYLFLTQEQTKAQLLQQKSSKSPSNALSFTCRQQPAVRCWVLGCSLLLLIIVLTMWTPAGRNYGSHTSWRTVPVANNLILLAHCELWAEHLSLGATKVEEVSGHALPSL